MSEGSSNEESNTNRVQCGGRRISVQDIEEQYGKHRKDAAATFNVSESTFRRKYKELGINTWPYPERKSSRLKSKVQKSSSSKNKIASSNKESCDDTSEETSPPSQMEENSSTSKRKNDVLIRQEIDDDDSVDHMGAQLSLENTKLLFNNLIALPMQVISDPDNETSMKKALTILEDNLTTFSKEQADQILVLLFDFPTLVRNWREYHSRSQTYNNLKLLDETEKIREMVKTSERDEESLKERYEELEKKEKELMQQLAAVQKEKAEVAEQRIQKSKQTNDLISLAEEKEAHRNTEERLTRIATAKLINLSEQWAELRSPFI